MPESGTGSQHIALVGELITLFVVLPLGFRLRLVPLPPISALWLLASYCAYRLFAKAAFNRKLLWNADLLFPVAPQILAIFAGCALLLGAGVHLLTPRLLFDSVRRAPVLWAVVTVLCPALSVYPQGVVYRALLFERYRALFPNPAVLIAMSAVAFSFPHIIFRIFRNPIAVGLTLIGGVLFAWRYAETRSLFTSSFEHALYGCWMFTVGLGEYFYQGARDRAVTRKKGAPPHREPDFVPVRPCA